MKHVIQDIWDKKRKTREIVEGNKLSGEIKRKRKVSELEILEVGPESESLEDSHTTGASVQVKRHCETTDVNPQAQSSSVLALGTAPSETHGPTELYFSDNALTG